MKRSSECTEQYAQIVFDTADIVREAIFQQLGLRGPQDEEPSQIRTPPKTA
jgi:hypothetical protein